MSQPAFRHATYADLEALPAGTRGEIIRGALYTFPRPHPNHAGIAGKVNHRLGPLFDPDDGDPGGWVILLEVELALSSQSPDETMVPDLSGWRKERASDVFAKARVSTIPDWVCEIVSPSTEEHDRGTKLPELAHYGVPWAWVIDPEDCLLEVFKLDERDRIFRPHGTRYQGNVTGVVPPFDTLTLDIGRFWGT